jgi:hypothetical protein
MNVRASAPAATSASLGRMGVPRFFPYLSPLLVGLVLAQASAARAQSEEELTRAREQFAEGVQLLEQEQWAEAAARFRSVLEVRSTPQVKLNLALALEHTGSLAEAARLLAEVLQEDDIDRRLFRQARQQLQALVPRLARITVHVQGDEGGAAIYLDGGELGLDRVGQSTPVDPGEHRVELRRGGAVVTSRTVTLTEGQEEEVTLVAPGGGGALGPLDEELLHTREREGGGGGGGDVTGEWWFWTIIGVAVLAVAGIAIGVGVAMSDTQAEAIQGDLMPGTIEVTFP